MGKANKYDENEEEYPVSDKYEDDDDKVKDDASMGAEAPLPYLQSIMASIQSLASTVVNLQIQQTGGKPQGVAIRRRPAPAIQAPEATPRRQPPPVDTARQPQAALKNLSPGSP